MRVLLVHNNDPANIDEGISFHEEKSLLEKNGHEVITYIKDNSEVKGYHVFKRIAYPLNMVYCGCTFWDMDAISKEKRPDIIHVHNFFPLISPSVYTFAKIRHVPIVQTMHSFRFICPNGLMFRNNNSCEECVTQNNPYLAAWHKCNESRLLSLNVASMLYINQTPFRKFISAYIALTEFNRTKFAEAGFPLEQIFVKSGFVRMEKKPEGKREDYAVYAGRLSPEKGIRTLANAWNGIGRRLAVFGDGPERQVINNPEIEVFGSVKHDECMEAIRRARFLILPSLWYESFPRAVIEAFSAGTPVLASHLGNMQAIVENKKTGLLFEPGNATDLRKKAEWLFSHPKECQEMGRNAYKVYTEKYTPEKSYETLMEIYSEAMKHPPK